MAEAMMELGGRCTVGCHVGGGGIPTRCSVITDVEVGTGPDIVAFQVGGSGILVDVVGPPMGPEAVDGAPSIVAPVK